MMSSEVMEKGARHDECIIIIIFHPSPITAAETNRQDVGPNSSGNDIVQ